jgi:thioredoxin reductase (NADPH)
MTDEIWDALVIGSGPGGLTAAVYLGRFHRRVLVIDGGASRAWRIPRTRNHPGFPDGIAGKTLIQRLRRHAKRYGAVIQNGYVEALSAQDGLFEARLAGDHPIHARTVLLATGVIDVEPDLPGFDGAVAKGLIRICPICDGYEVSAEKVAVIGQGEHAAREALFLRRYTDTVTLIHPGPSPSLPPSMQAALHQAGIETIETSIKAVTLDGGRIGAFDFGEGREHRFDTLYSALGCRPQSSLARDAGAAIDAENRLIVGDHQETSVPGLYAAGDLVRGLNQLTVAEAEGAIAAVDMHNRLREREAG